MARYPDPASYPKRCEHKDAHYPNTAPGWSQCSECGLVQQVDAETTSFISVDLRRRLRESWVLRQPGGGVSREQWLVAGLDEEERFTVCYYEIHQSGLARRTLADLLMNGPAELWRVGADGLAERVTAECPAWAVEIGESRRGRLSALAG